MLPFLVSGHLVPRLFEVPLGMARLVGGIVMMRIGLDPFASGQREAAWGVGGRRRSYRMEAEAP